MLSVISMMGSRRDRKPVFITIMGLPLSSGWPEPAGKPKPVCIMRQVTDWFVYLTKLWHDSCMERRHQGRLYCVRHSAGHSSAFVAAGPIGLVDLPRESVPLSSFFMATNRILRLLFCAMRSQSCLKAVALGLTCRQPWRPIGMHLP